VKATEQGSLVSVIGNIKSASDATMIRTAIQKLANEQMEKPIVLDIKDSFIITSSVIGALVKFINKDKLDIRLNIGNPELYAMLEEMELHRLFKATKAHQ
jgi:anti-anti-sigma regulatory factor